MNDVVSVTVRWTPELLAIGGRAFQKALPRKPLFVLLAILVPIAFVAYGFGDRIAAGLRGDDIMDAGTYRRGWFDAIMMTTGLIFAVILITARVRRAFGGKAATDSPFLSRPWILTLSVRGIQTKGPYNEGMVEWAAVTDVAATPSVIVLSLGGGGFLPLPHEGLPEGLSPAALQDRIAAWRSAAAF